MRLYVNQAASLPKKHPLLERKANSTLSQTLKDSDTCVLSTLWYNLMCRSGCKLIVYFGLNSK